MAVAVVLPPAARQDRSSSARGEEVWDDRVILRGCLVSIAEEARVPAEEAGRLDTIDVSRGDVVSSGSLLAKLDDSRAAMTVRAAESQHQVTLEQARNDSDIRFARKAIEVAEFELAQAIRANEKVPGTYSAMELHEKRLLVERAKLQREQSERLQRIAVLQSEAQQAEVDAAKADLAMRRITAPFDGMIVDVLRNRGEWVQAGDPIAHLVRMDKLQIEGFLKASKYSTADVQGRAVIVVVTLPGGRQETFDGRVSFASPVVQRTGEFPVWAEVENRREDGHWLLRPGVNADMAVQLTP